MKVEQLPPERVGELAAVYNDHVADVPLSEAVSVERFAEIWAWRSDRSAQLETEQAIYAAGEKGGHVGFAHVALGRFPGPELRGDQQPGPTGVIRLITYPPGRRDAGQALLEAAEARLMGQGASRILAFLNNGYLFQRFAYGELPDTCGHLVALLGMNGYRVARGEVFMRYANFVTEETILPDSRADLSVAHIPQTTGTRDSIRIVVRERGELIGICEGHSLGLWGSSDRSHATAVLGPMDVEDAFQGRGWGRFLADAMLGEARELGYRHTATSTQQENHRAQLFYTNMGYRVTDVAHSWLKDL
ncbi:MAG: GNAT family N-acetyltransferase [Gemmatimonadetes bacterium]|jgi:GNAT superfamily N-acetyltransferase|nr:GNAT family N-acetyltransferase [Gemmatimonadota bacterium]